MITLKDRARALENKFAYEQDVVFRAAARRNKLVGLWAAQLMERTDPIAYAEELAAWAVHNPSSEELVTQLRRDFDAARVAFPEDGLTDRLNAMLVEVLADMKAAA